MRHLKNGRKLGRNATHRLALMRNLSRALIDHGASSRRSKRPRNCGRSSRSSSLWPNTARCTRAGWPSLGCRTRKPSRSYSAKSARASPTRPGGYTRIIKRHEHRLGDGGHTAFIELLKEGETKVQSRTPAPAPRRDRTDAARAAYRDAASIASRANPEASTQEPQTPPVAPQQEQQHRRIRRPRNPLDLGERPA